MQLGAGYFPRGLLVVADTGFAVVRATRTPKPFPATFWP
jgi:hypothetical protein